MIRKILKWTGLIILFLLAGITVTTMARQHLKYEAEYPTIKASKDSALIAKGRHIVLGPGHCLDCHSPIKNVDSVLKLGQDPPLSGGMAFKLPFGTFYTRNLTSDPETGLGNFTDGEIARVLRHSVKKNGEAVLPFMPFQDLSDEDLTAVISYLRSTKPVKNKVPDHSYNAMGALIKAFLIKPSGPSQPPVASVKADTTAAYGRHLVMAVANCNECHTKRDGIGAYVGEPLAGGTEFSEEGHPTLYTPNLTPDPSSRIYGWSEADFIKRFRMGKLISYSHMPWESFGRMTDDELKAIYKYLKELKPVKTTFPAVKEAGK
ncbi:MAG TPA: cytochrome c [Flavisolibacter sp.]|jgi:mono/diheme cytochrome c family protein|nr:cytochrome c [Flavisolibacter sp.]